MTREEKPDLSALLRQVEVDLRKLDISTTMTPTGVNKPPLVRRRGRSVGAADKKAVMRVIRQPDGMLVWHAGPVGRSINTGRRRRASSSPPAPRGQVVEMYEYELLSRNKINELISKADKVLTGEQLGLLRLAPTGTNFVPVDAVETSSPRLLIVHGTFSNTEKMLTGADVAFLNWARQKYGGRVYAFNHPTLSVSPMINAFDLWRAFHDVTGDLDIVAHSRGGLVVRWFLEALGPSKLVNVRVVLVGSPLGGTSLAAPRQLGGALSAIGSFASAVSQGAEVVASVATPWLAVPAFMVQIASSVVGKTAEVISNAPILDAVISMVPGLAAQARINGNAEISRLHGLPDRANLKYFGVVSNFEPTDAGWKFWKRLRLSSIGDAAADAVFPENNDMVVDTGSMSELGRTRLMSDLHDFGTNPNVHHLNYFVQPKTTQRIQSWLA